MASAFSSSDDVMNRKIESSSLNTAVEDINETYEISRCVKWILQQKFKKIALQFPDDQLCHATIVCSQIQKEISDHDGIVFVLGDTSYGSCCVDEVGALHYNADSIIHFGHACLSKTCLLPILYVFGRSHIDIQDCVSKISEATRNDDNVILFYDTKYHYAIGNIFTELIQHPHPPVLARLSIPGIDEESKLDANVSSQSKDTSETEKKDIHLCGRIFHLPNESQMHEYTVIFIGDPSCPALINLMLTVNKSSFYTYNPAISIFQSETINVNKALMKRYYLIEKLKDANIIGIVVGTLGVANYKDIMEQVKSLVKLAGKKSYTFVVGKINPAKLANFAEVDIYVYVACRESSMIELSDFYRPVVTPLEVEFAFNKAREWTGIYSTDFQQLLPGGSLYIKPPETIDSKDETDVSLISNKVRSFGVRESPEISQGHSQEILKRSDALIVEAVSENAGQFLSTRGWQGLERKLGETPVVKATEGTDGIAFGYKHEPVT